MTVIIGFANKGGCYLGSDSLITSEYHIISECEKKIQLFNNDTLGIAFSGLCRIGNIIRDGLNIPENKNNLKDSEYIFNVVGYIRERIIDCGDVNDNDSFNMLIAHNKRIYTVDKGYCISEIHSRYFAEGHGAAYAMGAMYAVETRCDFKSKETKQYAQYIINAGLDAAINHSCGCGGKINIVRVS
jgi:ATP-dependent protease HslVU (ClpYQ) peptidase subunit